MPGVACISRYSRRMGAGSDEHGEWAMSVVVGWSAVRQARIVTC